MIQVLSDSPESTEALGEKLGSVLQGNEVIAYFGGLGMGKTCFTRGLARGMGLTAEVSSPTFALVHEYEGKIPLVHFDMYRITGPEDLYSTGYFDYLDSGSVLAVEWSENVRPALPDTAIRITFSRGQTEECRVVTMEGEQKYENSWR